MLSKDYKILIIRLGAIGDVVHTTNTYRAIKKAYPRTEIHYMTTKTQACFLENDVDIEKVWIVDKNDLKLCKSQKLAKLLKNEKFDLVINLQPNFKTRFLCLLSGIKKALIYKKTFKKHAVENFFDTAQKYFKNLELDSEMTIYISPKAKETAIRQLMELKRPLIAFNAGGIISPRQGRTYPLEQWITLAELVRNKFNGTIILTGAKEDEELLARLTELTNIKSFIGKTTLEENAAIINECDVMVSGDSGPLHIASALGVPSIGLYGSMPVNRTGTYGKNCVSISSKVPCAPCNRRKCKFLKHSKNLYAPCMAAISTEEILTCIENCLNIPKRDK